jgi:hypothetical protein
MPVEIKIGLSGNKVRPENDPPRTTNNKRTKVSRGDSVVFTVPAGFQGASITFDGASPLGPLPQDKVIPYGVTRQIPALAPVGIFSYTCTLTGPDGVEHSSSGGGEMEID